MAAVCFFDLGPAPATVLIDEKGICMGNDFCLPSYVPVFAVGSLLGANWKSKIAPVCNKVPLVIEVTAALSLILASRRCAPSDLRQVELLEHDHASEISSDDVLNDVFGSSKLDCHNCSGGHVRPWCTISCHFANGFFPIHWKGVVLYVPDQHVGI